jgi:hypothetical protein
MSADTGAGAEVRTARRPGSGSARGTRTGAFLGVVDRSGAVADATGQVNADQEAAALRWVHGAGVDQAEG